MVSSLLVSLFVSLSPNFNCDGPNCNFIMGEKEFVVVEVTDDITEMSAQLFAKQMSDAEKTDQPFIPIIISSYGGSVIALLEMIDTLQESKKPIMTIIRGKAMSAGIVLASFGAEGMRFASPNSTIMVHEVSGGSQGKLAEMETSVEEAARLNKKILEMMAINTGHDKDFFIRAIDDRGHTDWFMSPKEAMRINLINLLGSPTIDINLSVDVVVR
jgi:ATP-dependent Clp protease protease subunit